MQTLSYGYKKPETGDRGSIFWPALEFDIQRLNDHSHDGTNSQKLLASSVQGIDDTILATNWVAVAGQTGTYRQLVTMPPNVLFDDYGMTFRVSSAGPAIGRQLALTVEKFAAGTFYVYINDNSLDLQVLYLV